MSDAETITRTKTELKEPSLYNVVFHNDDYTPMEFVVAVLIQLFDKTQEESESLMLEIHNKGRGVAGTFTFEIASTKKSETEWFAKQNGHPLKITLKEAS